MAITFPRTDVMELLRTWQVDFKPVRRDSVSRTARQTFARELGEPLWTATITSEPMSFGASLELQAALESLRGPLNSCYVYDRRREWPASEGDGGFTDGNTINGVRNGNEIRFGGALGLTTDLTVGDYIAWDWGAAPSRALHRVLENVTAGSTAYFAVEPDVLGDPTGVATIRKQPAMEAVLAEEWEARQVNAREMQYTVRFIQVIR